jgi:hypothetical protein
MAVDDKDGERHYEDATQQQLQQRLAGGQLTVPAGTGE